MSAPDSPPLVLSYAEAGKQLMGASERTIRRMVAKGELPTVRVRGRVGIPYTAIAEYVQNNTNYSAKSGKRACRTNGKTAGSGGSATPTPAAGSTADRLKLLIGGKQ